MELRLRTDRSPDLDPPKIVDGPTVASIDDQSAVIEWTTDEVADSFVDYDSSPYLGQVVGSPEYVQQHRMMLTNLAPGTTYHFKVGSRDRAANGPVESGVTTFATLADADREAPATPSGLAADPGGEANWLEWEPATAPDLAAAPA